MIRRLVPTVLLVFTLVVVPDVVLLPPQGPVALDAIEGLEFAAGALVVNLESHVQLTIDETGHLVSARWRPRVAASEPPELRTPAPAFRLGIDVELPLVASAPHQSAWASPRGPVVWETRQGVKVFDAVAPQWWLDIARTLWPWVLGLWALVLGADVFRALGRWLGQPGFLAVKVTLVSLPLLGMVTAALWWTPQPHDEALRAEMEFFGTLVGQGQVPSDVGTLEFSHHGVEGDRLVPPPHEMSREYRAVLRSGTPQALAPRPGRPWDTVLVPVVGDHVVRSLVEVRSNASPRMPSPDLVSQLALALGLFAVGGPLLAWALVLVRGTPRGQSPRHRLPRRWLETWGPDLLARPRRRLPMTKRVVVVTWPREAPAEAHDALAAAGVLEVESPEGPRRGLSPGGVRPLAAVWDRGLVSWLRVELARVDLGLLDAASTLVPLVTGLPPVVEPAPGLSLDGGARRRWPNRTRAGSAPRPSRGTGLGRPSEVTRRPEVPGWEPRPPAPPRG